MVFVVFGLWSCFRQMPVYPLVLDEYRYFLSVLFWIIPVFVRYILSVFSMCQPDDGETQPYHDPKVEEDIRVQGSGFRVQGFRVQGFRVQGSGLCVQGCGFWVQGSGFRVGGCGLGFRVKG